VTVLEDERDDAQGGADAEQVQHGGGLGRDQQRAEDHRQHAFLRGGIAALQQRRAAASR
jgi:hypothetical protein